MDPILTSQHSLWLYEEKRRRDGRKGGREGGREGGRDGWILTAIYALVPMKVFVNEVISCMYIHVVVM